MLYTRKGDRGTSGLFGTKDRFPKDSPVYEALGTLDELNSLLGFCRACATKINNADVLIPQEILKAQRCLFVIQAEMGGSSKSLAQMHIDELEGLIDALEDRVGNPHAFIIPGATELSGILDYSRAVCRRAERTLVTIAIGRTVSDASIVYMNRLSSLLYILARYAASLQNAKELSPDYT